MSDRIEIPADGTWIPFRADWSGNFPVFQWMFAGTKKFTEPFFEESLSTCRFLNREMAIITTDGTELLRVAEKLKGAAPCTLVFHVSRCGSTLLSQLLNADGNNVVLSEVPLLDELLFQYHRGKSEALIYFKAVADILGYRQADVSTRSIIKLDSWHLKYYEVLRQLYPETLFVFLCREPKEVVRSHNRQAGIQAVKGTRISEVLFNEQQLREMDATGYLSNVLEEYYRIISIVHASDKNAIVFDYRDGILNLVQQIYVRCGIPFTTRVQAAMEARMKFHSKRTHDLFSEAGVVSQHFRVREETIAMYTLLSDKIRMNVYDTR